MVELLLGQVAITLAACGGAAIEHHVCLGDEKKGFEIVPCFVGVVLVVPFFELVFVEASGENQRVGLC